MKNITKLMKFINSELQKEKINIRFCKTSYCRLTSVFCFNYIFNNTIEKIEIVYRLDECLKIMFKFRRDCKSNLVNTDIIEKIKKILKDFLSEELICSYNIKDAENIVPAYAMEWNFIDPEQRISFLAERQIASHRKTIDNLMLYGKRDIYNYTNKEMILLFKNPDFKVPGIYMGTVCSFWESDNLSEIELYEEIRKWINTKYLTMNFENFEKQKEECYGFDYLKYLTKKFGVEFASLLNEKDALESESFNSWYSYYDNYIKNIFSQRDRKRLNKKMSLGEDVTNLIPSWKEYKNSGKQLKKDIL